MQNFDNYNYDKYKKMSEDEFWLRVNELEVKISEIGLGLIKEYGSGGLKALLLLNGAAGIAILAFLGNVLGTEFEHWIRGIVWGLVFFSIGAFFLLFLGYLPISHKLTITKQMVMIKRLRRVLSGAILQLELFLLVESLFLLVDIWYFML